MSTWETRWPTVIGHEWAVNLLSGALAGDRLAHAYLLSGPAQIGKTCLARAFAQTLNCETGELNPCMACRSCQLIAEDKHPDVRMIRPQLSRSGRTETLRIEQVRNLQKELALAPYEGRYQVAIVTRFHKASLGAANALLKTLEEPPKNVVIVLTADLADSLLPTIISRCQSLTLRPLPLAQVESALMNRWGATESQARLLAHLSGGRLGMAVRLLSDPDNLDLRQEQLDTLELLLERDRTERFLYAEKLTRRNAEIALEETLELWLGWWRDVMLVAGGARDPLPITNIDRENRIREAADRYGLGTAGAAVRAIRETLWQLSCNANARLAVEVLMLDMPLA
jgi:DNA polymerase-3 subunit delta'